MPLFSLAGRRPVLPPAGHYWIAPTACLIGDVRLGAEAGIWFGAVLRGDNEPIVIGARSNVQDLCVVHTDQGYPVTVGEDCTVGHGAILHGCTIEEGSLIGMGAVLLNGAKVGRGSLVGARALITEGKSFPDHSVILGAPAQLIRTLDAEAIEALRESAKHYVENGRRFAQGLKSVEETF